MVRSGAKRFALLETIGYAVPPHSQPTLLDPVRNALEQCRPHFMAAALFSAVGNILLLTPALYMMQVYDRVVPTGALVTLAALSVVALFGLGALSALEWLRGRLLVRAGAQLDAALAGQALRLVMSRPDLGPVARAEAMRDLDTLRQTISSPAAAALFDAPWAPVYIIAAFLLHPALGMLTTGAAALMLALAWHNERRMRGPVRKAGDASNAAYARQLQISTHAAEVRALGIADALVRRQLGERAMVNEVQQRASFSGGNHSGLMRFLRLALQSAALAVGAVLVVEGNVSGGAVFASSLLLSRALQPIEQLVASWKSILQTRTAYARLGALFNTELVREHTRLPDPTGAFQVERLTVLAPLSDRVALADVSFAIEAGEVIGIVGPSGAGKSTLLRALAGAALPVRGHIRLDGASTADWDSEQLSRHIGYLPQSCALFPGTVKENISRFRGLLGEGGPQLDADVIAAARHIGAHEMILRLPHGYDTPVGGGGQGLSAGQTQRIAIARALFGNPRLLFLDEPTAHLDGPAQHAFIKMLSTVRSLGTTVLFATHSGDILASADRMLLLKEGRVESLGPISEVLPRLRPKAHIAKKTS